MTRHLPSPPPPQRMPPDHVGALISGVMMMGVGWGGLALLIYARPPRLGPEIWLFFFLFLMAITGTVLPLVRYINMRLTPITVEPVTGGILVRQSVWIGLFGVIVAWMQLLRVLSAANVFFLALVFVVLEVFLRSRERNSV